MHARKLFLSLPKVQARFFFLSAWFAVHFPIYLWELDSYVNPIIKHLRNPHLVALWHWIFHIRWGFPGNIRFFIVYIIELDDGEIYRKALYLMVKNMVSCRFSLKPIQWIYPIKSNSSLPGARRIPALGVVRSSVVPPPCEWRLAPGAPTHRPHRTALATTEWKNQQKWGINMLAIQQLLR